MTYWYLLIISYAVETNNPETIEFKIAIRDQETCAEFMDVIYPLINAEYRNSSSICIQTDEPWGSIRPKARPIK
tara:strand:- start:151 stop:372 length:222 start_codon:yes stop_codon:yes gene_type:complete